jgi:diaminohydroxyphosphoribosylaminopyrimidine deaminase / 5-amino-6-(5-phosphoribosylamino)uracil reductase
MSLYDDSYFMNLALKEAEKGFGFTSPNPMVGAVIVKNDKILAKGYHHKVGLDHAEVDAIKKIRNSADLKNSTIYVNLEPCSHTGRTPPCTDKIIASGIKNLVIANKDIDTRVHGLKILKKAGVNIKTGILEKDAIDLNSIYFYWKKNKKPYIVLKAALTLDGKIASYNGDSKWISNESSREIVHKLRLRLKAIAVGKNTILHDKPKLNCRIKGFEEKPVDKLVFSNEKISTKSFVKNSGKIHFINKKISASKEIFLKYSVENEIDSILIEGGSGIYSWFLENNLVDRIFLFYKPAFLGKDGINIFNKTGINSIKKLQEFEINDIKTIDNNFLIDMSKGKALCLQV